MIAPSTPCTSSNGLTATAPAQRPVTRGAWRTAGASGSAGGLAETATCLTAVRREGVRGRRRGGGPRLSAESGIARKKNDAVSWHVLDYPTNIGIVRGRGLGGDNSGS